MNPRLLIVVHVRVCSEILVPFIYWCFELVDKTGYTSDWCKIPKIGQLSRPIHIFVLVLRVIELLIKLSVRYEYLLLVWYSYHVMILKASEYTEYLIGFSPGGNRYQQKNSTWWRCTVRYSYKFYSTTVPYFGCRTQNRTGNNAGGAAGCLLNGAGHSGGIGAPRFVYVVWN